MIRINLLPVRAIKKKETFKQQIFILLFCVTAVVLVALGAFSLLQAKIVKLNDEVAKSESDLKQLKAKSGEIDNIKKLQEDVQKKLNVLNQLRKEKTGPAERLAKLSEATPDRLWLTKYAENGTSLSLSGVGYNEELIAEFMRNLQATGYFANIELTETTQTEFGGIKAKKFDITCVIKSGEAQPAANPDSKTSPPGKN